MTIKEDLTELGFDDINAFYIDATAKRARDGDKEAVLEILQDFSDAVEESSEPHRPYMEFLADAFKKILDGTSPKVALGLNNPRHRPKSSETESRNLEIALDVGIMIANGVEEKRAKYQAAARRDVSFDVAEKAYTAAKKGEGFDIYIGLNAKHGLPAVSRRKK